MSEHFHKNKNLDYCMRDGRAWMVMQGSGDSFISVFAIALKATSLQVGLITTFAAVIGGFVQLFAPSFMKFFSNRRAILVSITSLQATTWVFLAVLAFYAIPSQSLVYITILLYCLVISSNSFSSPVWNSLIGDLIPDRIRGTFFGYKARKAIISLLITIIAAGVILEASKYYGEFVGFAILFTLAGASRYLSSYYLSKHDNPKYEEDVQSDFNLKNFIKLAPRTNFGKYVLFIGMFFFSVFIFAPYVAVYLMRTLSWNYYEFTLFLVVGFLAQIFVVSHWGEVSDKYGNKFIMALSGIGISIIPILYVVSSNMIWILLINALSGATWAGFNLAISSFLFDAVSPKNRAKCNAYQTFINTLAMFLGTLLGGLLLGQFESFLSSREGFIYLFCISGILRGAVGSYMLPKFKEVKDVEHHGNYFLLRRVGTMRYVDKINFQLVTAVFKSKDKKK